MENALISSARFRALLGEISDMTLWRWSTDAALHFPVPVYIRTRRFWREAEVLAWIEDRAAASENAPRPSRPGEKATATVAA